eukprot:Protomagalhaensia_sp_Gyna_25__1225@NODE_160_length_4733_cov_8_648487_g125_i0_p1_GENE_NODE_160_length_4733_cov_8_648487_g125_i0NODE_160_length_4733_cov_8_648487_g125_i0_p1_ORF_typecomplete_len1005_score149_40Alpha_adaptin_C/PF02296_16/1_2e07ATG16/PF08614_11/3_9e03ATG16/PF08614_11/1_6e06ATG16/PF08614_11/81AAA_13/PF13166_6/1_1e03AAA_13/PF13166_6/0_00095Alpha_adaptinC2/PF02883_20/0_0069TMCO5/PF14992_6/0_021ERM/PF00769_19/0_12Leu_zip/PF15294_6/0_21Myosin_tail_1/PF01576_19/0_25Phage_HK97_TLTM/PF06120_
MSVLSSRSQKGPSPDEFDFLLLSIDWRRSLQAASDSPIGKLVLKTVIDRSAYTTCLAELSQTALKGGIRSMRTAIESLTYVLVSTTFTAKCKIRAIELLKHLIEVDRTYAVAVTTSLNIVSLLRSISQPAPLRDYVLSKLLSSRDYDSAAVGGVVAEAQRFIRYWDCENFQDFHSEGVGTSLNSNGSADCLEEQRQGQFFVSAPITAAPAPSDSKGSGRPSVTKSSRRAKSDRIRSKPVSTVIPKGPLATKLDSAQDLVKTMHDAIGSNPEGPDGEKLLGDLRQELSKCVEDLQIEATKAVDHERMADFTRISRVVDDVNMAIQMNDAYLEGLNNNNKRQMPSRPTHVGSTGSKDIVLTDTQPPDPSPSHHTVMDLPGGFEIPSSWETPNPGGTGTLDSKLMDPFGEPERNNVTHPTASIGGQDDFPAAPDWAPIPLSKDEEGKRRTRSKRRTADSGNAPAVVWPPEDTAPPPGGSSLRSSQSQAIPWDSPVVSLPPPPRVPSPPKLPSPPGVASNASADANKAIALEAMVNRLLNEKSALENDVRSLSSRMTKYRLELEDKNATIADLNREKARLTRELEKSKVAALDADKALTHAKDMWLRENGRASSLGASLDEKENQLLKKSNQVKELKMDLDATQKRLSHLEYLVSRRENLLQSSPHRDRRFSTQEDDASQRDSDESGDFQAPPPTKQVSKERMRRHLTSAETSATSLARGGFNVHMGWHRFSGRDEGAENLKRFRHLLTVDEGILHVEDNVLEIGVRSVYDGTINTSRIYFGNLSNGVLETFTVEVTTFEWDPVGHGNEGLPTQYRSRRDEALRWNASPVPATIVQGQQICQSLIIECLAPYTFIPMMVVKFLLPDATPRLLNLPLPFPVTKFLSPLRLGSVEFFKRWKNYQFVASEVSSVFMLWPALLSPLSNLIKLIQLEGSLELHLGLDSDPNNLILAGTYPPPGNPSIPLSTVLVRFEVGSGRSVGKGRVAVRSDSPELADGVRRVLTSLCASH